MLRCTRRRLPRPLRAVPLVLLAVPLGLLAAVVPEAEATMFATPDLVGTWRIYVIGGASDASEVLTARGVLAVGAGGVVTGGTVTRSQGVSQNVTGNITGGALAIDGRGVIRGTLIVENTARLVLAELKMDDHKLLMSGIGEDRWRTRFLLTAVKAGGAFAQADLAGTYSMYAFADRISGGAASTYRGSLTIDGDGEVSSGALTDAAGTTLPLTGTLTMDSEGVVTGSLPSSPGVTLTVTEGKMDGDKSVIAAVASLSGAATVNLVAVLVRSATGFATSDLAGTWQVSAYRERIAGGTETAALRGTVSLDASGAVTGGRLVDWWGASAQAVRLPGSGTLALGSGGTGTGQIGAADLASPLSLVDLAMDARKTLAVGVGHEGGDRRLIVSLVKDTSAVAIAGAASVLPTSRAVSVGVPATAFATLLVAGAQGATACSIVRMNALPGAFLYQPTDAGNVPTGTPNTPVDIPAGGAQTFVLAFTPSAAFPAIEAELSFSCANSGMAPLTFGLNTLLLAAHDAPVPDIVALAATTGNNGIVDIPGPAGTGAFAVATVNVGATDQILVSAEPTPASLPLTATVCQTDPQTGLCQGLPASSVLTTIASGATPTFSIFATASGEVPFEPATSRVRVLFRRAATSDVHGSTSVAARTVAVP